MGAESGRLRCPILALGPVAASYTSEEVTAGVIRHLEARSPWHLCNAGAWSGAGDGARGGCGAETGRGCGQKQEETVTAKDVIGLQKPEKLGDWFFPRVSGGTRPSVQLLTCV